MKSLAVHDSRIEAWFYSIVTPIGIFILIIALVQSFGIQVVALSALTPAPDWLTRLFICLIIIVWLRSAPTVWKRGRKSRLLLLVSAEGVEAPEVTKLTWDQLDSVSQSFGWIKFKPKKPSKPGFQIWAFSVNRAEWRVAKAEITRRLDEQD